MRTTPVWFAALAVPLGIIALVVSYNTATYLFAGQITTDGLFPRLLTAGVFDGAFCLLLWKRPKAS